jgi:carbohydrate-binding DOMON domain-containing protein
MKAILFGTLMLISNVAFSKTIVFKDPVGEDNGPGTYVYPTDAVYKRGSFDLVKFEVRSKGSEVEFRATMRARIEDPWDSRSWGGNGFSLQMLQVYIDKDRKEGSGHRAALPGINVDFAKASYWEKVVVMSPQGRERLASEVELKANDVRRDVVIPRRTYSSGRTIVAVVSKKDLGGELRDEWGFQVIVQSNEGFPDKGDLLSRKINEVEGPHRFGGGDDGDCDPHVLDLLAGNADGDRSEVEAQKKDLGSFSCKAGRRAEIGMVYKHKK